MPAFQREVLVRFGHCDAAGWVFYPRYFEMIEALPKTPSMRVQKFDLRARGNGPDTWDLTANGLKVTRAGLVAV